MRSVMRHCALVATLVNLTGSLQASSGTDTPSQAPTPPPSDIVDVTEKAGKHSHIWMVELSELGRIALEDLRLTVLYGPGCAPPSSIWRQLAAGVMAAGAASLRSGAASTLGGTIASSLVIAPSLHSSFGGKKLRHIGGSWYALTFPCRHDAAAGDPSARLFIHAPAAGQAGELILATPWRPLASGGSMRALTEE